MRGLFMMLLLVFLSFLVVRGQESVVAPDYFAEVIVDNSTPYIGEQISYRFRFYDAVGVANPLYEAPDFEGFWQIDKQTINRAVQQRDNRQYTVTEIDAALYPTRLGTITIAAPKVLLPQTVFRPQEEVSAGPVSIDVQALPDGEPDGFAGAVGQYNLSATIDRQSAILGEPFTLQLTVRGTGNVEQLTLPDLPQPDVNWRIYPNPTMFTTQEVNGLVVGEKVYEYLLFPGQVGSQTLPTVTLHYFDPVNALYRSVSTQPVSLEILPSTETTAQPFADLTPIPQQSLPLSLKPVSITNQGGTIIPGILFWLLWLLPPVGAAGSWWWMRRREQQRQRRAATRKSMALNRLQIRLQDLARSKVTTDSIYRLVREIVIDYFGDKLSRHSESLTDSDIERILADQNFPPVLSERVMLCLEWADEGQYAPSGAIDIPTLIGRVSETLAVVDGTWNSK